MKTKLIKFLLCFAPVKVRTCGGIRYRYKSMFGEFYFIDKEVIS